MESTCYMLGLHALPIKAVPFPTSCTTHLPSHAEHTVFPLHRQSNCWRGREYTLLIRNPNIVNVARLTSDTETNRPVCTYSRLCPHLDRRVEARFGRGRRDGRNASTQELPCTIGTRFVLSSFEESYTHYVDIDIVHGGTVLPCLEREM